LRYIPKTNSVADDIEIMRRDLVNWSFDGAKCSQLVSHIGNYHENENTGKPCHKNNCSICRGASHGVDAVRQLAVGRHMRIVQPYLRDVEKKDNKRIYNTEGSWMLIA